MVLCHIYARILVILCLDARIISKQPLWLFQSLTLPALRAFAGLQPDRCPRVWAQWCRKAGALGLYRSIQSLSEWSDSGELLPRFQALPHKAYIYGENGKRKKDVVPELDTSITYEIPSSGHVLMTDNPNDFYATVARIIRAA